MRSSDHIPGFSRTSETDKKDNSNEFSDRLLGLLRDSAVGQTFQPDGQEMGWVAHGNPIGVLRCEKRSTLGKNIPVH